MNSLIKSYSKNALEIVLDNRSRYLRGLVVKALLGGGRGHMGSAMSLIEILRAIYDDFAQFNPLNPEDENRDRIILSKGHGCLALYAILADKKFIDKKELENVGTFDSILGGHPEHFKVPGVEASTGALGHGLPIGVGIATALKIKSKNQKTIVVVGDGEINEGVVWESAMSASKHKLNNLIVMIDYNKIQSYGFTKDVLDLEPLTDKLLSFGFSVSNVNGHCMKELSESLVSTKNSKQPNAIICHTIKGKGFSFSENNPLWHHKNNFTEEEIKLLKENILL